MLGPTMLVQVGAGGGVGEGTGVGLGGGVVCALAGPADSPPASSVIASATANAFLIPGHNGATPPPFRPVAARTPPTHRQRACIDAGVIFTATIAARCR